MKKVSVITGFYNREKFVADSINSILTQTFEDFEYIIFDDASTDNTGNLISAVNDERIVRLMFKENRGFINGLIDAVERSSGDYIFIHGAGDISLPDRIKKQLEILKNANYGVVGCYYDNISEENEIINSVKTKQDELTFEKMLIYNRISHGEVGFKKNIYNKAGGYDKRFKFSQDFDLWLRMIKQTEFYIVPEVLYNRRMIKNSVSIRPDKIIEQSKYSFLAREVNKFPEKRAKILKDLENGSISKLIPDSNSFTQKICIKKSLLLINFGYFDDSAKLIKNITNPFVRCGIKSINFLIRKKIMSGKLFQSTIELIRASKTVIAKVKHQEMISVNN
jgi:glycosyltransferase involved in cell wall biosynthesis